MMRNRSTRLVSLPIAALLATGLAAPAAGQNPPAAPPGAEPPYFSDRGTGLSTSMFGTYIRRGELLVYPFYEYYNDSNYEYKPEELGVAGDTDYRGCYRAHEGLIFLAYGIRNNLAFEMEIAGISASLTKSPGDPSALPTRLEESGLGDIEGQLRWRWLAENERRPEVFSYFEAVVPHAESKLLIGTPDWELKLGAGLVRGFRWGTLTARGAVEYTAGSTSQFDIGEYAVEYLKRVSPRFRLVLVLEGEQDELSGIGEVQWSLRPWAVVKANLGRGLTSKATDWAPELGILFSWSGR